MFNKKILLMFCMILLIGISFVSADKIVQTQENTQGLQIFYPDYSIVPQNIDFDLHLHVINATNGVHLSNTNVDCFLHLYNSSGKHTFESNALTKNANGWDHEIEIDKGNFSDVGDHAFFIWCNTTTTGGDVRGTFLVTEDGIDLTEGRSLLIIGLISILVFLLFISLYSLFSIEHYIGKFVLYWVSHILIILITFVSWQIGVEGLFGGFALTGIFKIMFWFFLIGSFPMLILSLAWIFYIHTYNEHFQKLVDKGEDPETAFKMMDKKNKRRRW